MRNIEVAASWHHQVPKVAQWLLNFGALWSLLAALFSHHLQEVFFNGFLFFWTLNIPASYSLVTAVFLALLGMATARRKRVMVWVLMFFAALSVPELLFSLSDLQDSDIYLPQRIAIVAGAFFGIVTVVILFLARDAFPGKIIRGAKRNAILVLLGGLGAVAVIGMVAVQAVPGKLVSAPDQVRWVLRNVLGQDLVGVFAAPVNHGPKVLGAMLSISAALVLFAAFIVFIRGQRMPGRTRDYDLALRELLLRYPTDSLAYFSTRSDRSTVFSPDGRAAISYSVASGVAIAGGDPIGDRSSWESAIEAWKTQCARFGWNVGAISVSEDGARAYRKMGLKVRLMGDEAVIDVASFDLTSPQMKPIATALRRARRAGVSFEVRTLGEIPEEERNDLAQAAEKFRDGEERGFSMALDRILDPIDAHTLVMTAELDGQLQCLLTFVPWGRRAYSLNLMRRNRDSINGIVEAMVAHLVDECRGRSIDRISLNFAMFRKVFVDGLAVDAGITKRILRHVMLLASKMWQLDSLYEANARYYPVWVPRYLCYSSVSELAQTLVASAMLEGFFPYPKWARRIDAADGWYENDAHLSDIQAIEERVFAEQFTARKVSEQEQVRRDKAQLLRDKGRDPYPAGLSLGLSPKYVLDNCAELLGTDLEMGGRIRAVRDHGGVIFADMGREGANIQVMLRADKCLEGFTDFRLCDLGDIIVVNGTLTHTRTGQLSIDVSEWTMGAKSLRPVPRAGVRLDAATRVRRRTMHLLTDYSALQLLKYRCEVVASIRKTMQERGFMEVETPMLQAVQGGANARPFVTHLNAYSSNVFLRIAPELYLKRLAVAGMEAIFEIGRSFRNEGADATHNPEFTSLEAYLAGGDYTTMRLLTQELLQKAAIAVHGKCVVWRPVGTAGTQGLKPVATVDDVEMVEVDISGSWPVVPVYEAVSKACGQQITPHTSLAELQILCDRYNIESAPGADEGALVTDLYDELVEAHTVKPTFYTDFPVSTSPLTRAHRTQEKLAERWDLVAFGMELGTAYSELADPAEQRARLTAQSMKAAAGDPEAMSLDEDFLSSLEYGMPSTGGLGIGVDRAAMLITGTNIRQMLCFPFVRPEHN